MFGKSIPSTQLFATPSILDMGNPQSSQVGQKSDMVSQDNIRLLNDRFARLEVMLESLVAKPENSHQLGQHVSTAPRIEPVTATPTRTTEEQSNSRLERVESILLTVAENQARALQQPTNPATQPIVEKDATVCAASLWGNEIPQLDGMVRDCYTVIGWLGRLEVLFSTKGLTVDTERIKAAGIGITDLQWGEWYRISHQELQTLTWTGFCKSIKQQFLPPSWESEILRDIRTLKMGDKESFEQFSY
ncbi:hypothetical protein CROQUDRAFT_102246 [Cronartium quercuum f. sp. fusiforme G11]|uniref:Retrotransposon gag domain-containing protein n=1 Tax=Cronartium quercuum f. sp. fusiforme G11 TaxID=708437 RepID=A0A9P6N7B6_9BASI|nr:hypothetical protein CROQUDRAFT_102246 [Cronartium quercuum f. sp. fusiforme G11]